MRNLRNRMIHRVDVARFVETIGSNLKRTTTKTTVCRDLQCLVLGLQHRAKTSLVGRVDGAQFTISWPGETALQDGDIVTFRSKDYNLREILDDTTRDTAPYYTGVLQERKK